MFINGAHTCIGSVFVAVCPIYSIGIAIALRLFRTISRSYSMQETHILRRLGELEVLWCCSQSHFRDVVDITGIMTLVYNQIFLCQSGCKRDTVSIPIEILTVAISSNTTINVSGKVVLRICTQTCNYRSDYIYLS